MALDGLTEEVRPKEWLEVSHVNKWKECSRKRSSKCSGSEVIMLRMNQGQKGTGVAGGCEAIYGLGRWAGIASCQAVPAELRNFGNDMSLKQDGAAHFLNCSCCPNISNFCVSCLSAFAFAVFSVLNSPSLFYLTNSYSYFGPVYMSFPVWSFPWPSQAGWLSHFLFFERQNSDLFPDNLSLKTMSSLKTRVISCFFASPLYSTSHPQTLWELRPCLNHVYVFTLLIHPPLLHLVEGVPH